MFPTLRSGVPSIKLIWKKVSVSGHPKAKVGYLRYLGTLTAQPQAWWPSGQCTRAHIKWSRFEPSSGVEQDSFRSKCPLALTTQMYNRLFYSCVLRHQAFE